MITKSQIILISGETARYELTHLNSALFVKILSVALKELIEGDHFDMDVFKVV